MKIPPGWYKLRSNAVIRAGDKYYDRSVGKWTKTIRGTQGLTTSDIYSNASGYFYIRRRKTIKSK